MKIPLEGIISIVLTPFLGFELREMIILLSIMSAVQVAIFFSFKLDEKRYLLMNLSYTTGLAIYFVECAVKLQNFSVLILHFICIEIGQERVKKELLQKLTILINLYALIRVCSWNSYDIYTFIGGISLLLILLFVLQANQQKQDNYPQTSYVKSYEKSISNVVQSPDYRKQQYHSSATNLQQELQECSHFFNLIPDPLILLMAQDLAIYFCNSATLELFKITDKSNFKTCLEQLSEVVTTQAKPDIRDPRDSLPSFQSFQQTFQQYKFSNKRLSKEEIELNQLLCDLRNIKANKRFFQILKNSPHNTVFIGSYLGNRYENDGRGDLEQPKKRLLEINAHATLIDDKLMILLQIRDVTHRDYIKLIQKQYQVKSSIISFVSHEYRTPLNSIIQFISALQDERDPNLQSKYIKISLLNCKYLLNLSNDLLDFAQLKAGKFSINPVQMDLKRLIEECMELFNLEASLKKIDLSLNFRKNVPKLLNNDPNRIRQIIINLLGNAFKYTLQGYIEINVSNYHTSSLKIEVRDTGLGIKEEHKERLLQAFVRVEDKESKKLNPQGVGLGLIISNMIARNLSFNERGLQFQSEYQSGSSFWFYISKNISESEIDEESENIDEESPERRQSLWRYNNIKSQHINKCQCANILIVDDNAFNIEVLKFLIQKINSSLKLEYSLDGHTAIQMVNSNRCNNCNGYDAIFMDIDMPTMNGIQATSIIKKQYPKIQIIGCSAYAKQEEENLAIQNGMDGYLVKPVQIEQLKTYLKLEF
ncbi:unnamed protein product (macronuclear) [Paramecium tetraurelia]|uniref:Uncharacterized protein n=1 Tax=Paramecium tetraurelia TaxID=5888 RepID=A0BG13_PARTE|nr:uncharacterized protein GSPATT00028515001 [Paramecium tetraurelia]CAK57480.1 unnamed protein product [Paramecium tetraurelia]|eukprot:XP_001424878.1 hypothetical protein (macronuclear) [Paramecium tetraurelia strain d4-2]